MSETTAVCPSKAALMKNPAEAEKLVLVQIFYADANPDPKWFLLDGYPLTSWDFAQQRKIACDALRLCQQHEGGARVVRGEYMNFDAVPVTDEDRAYLGWRILTAASATDPSRPNMRPGPEADPSTPEAAAAYQERHGE